MQFGAEISRQAGLGTGGGDAAVEYNGRHGHPHETDSQDPLPTQDDLRSELEFSEMAIKSRPSLPADLRRRVLIEAGHRCAIQTCRHPTVDVHHIEPWARCREHSFKNLIALCPNCHRRAEAGEVDRKSLRLYKARLAAALNFDNTAATHSTGREKLEASFRAALWRTIELKDSVETAEYYVELDYPEFVELGPGVEAANAALGRLPQERMKWFRGETIESVDAGEFSVGEVGDSLTGSYAVAFLSDKILSVRFTFSTFTSGAAHPNHWTEVINAMLQPFSLLEVRDLFVEHDRGVGLLSKYCVAQLLKRDDLACDPKWVRDGAGPREENFASFNFVPQGLLVNFDSYQVGPYAVGPSEVVVPYEKIASALAPALGEALLRGGLAGEACVTTQLASVVGLLDE